MLDFEDDLIMTRKIRVTNHGKRRIQERVEEKYNLSSFARIVSKNGKGKEMYEGKFYQFLLSKSFIRGAIIKVYKNNIYVLAKNSRNLITTYQIPEKYLPVEQYEKSSKTINLLNIIHMYIKKPVIIKLQNNKILRGYISNDDFHKTITKIIVKTHDDKIMVVKLKDICEINLDEELLSKELKEYIQV